MIYHKSPDIYAFLFKIKSINWQQQKKIMRMLLVQFICCPKFNQFVCSEIN